jgi:hypothetical protein
MSSLTLLVNKEFTSFQPRTDTKGGIIKLGDKVFVNARHYRENGQLSESPGIGILVEIKPKQRRVLVSVNGCKAEYLLDYVSSPYLNLIKGGQDTTAFDRLLYRMRFNARQESKKRKELKQQKVKEMINRTPSKY